MFAEPSATSRHGSLEVDLENLSENPRCPHGPTILFQRTFTKSGGVCGKNSFYACSAYRDKKDCNFYLPFERRKTLPQAKVQAERNTHTSESPSHASKSVTPGASSSLEQRFCRPCSRSIQKEDEAAEHPHKVLDTVDVQFPTRFLPTLNKKESEAQYFFSEATKRFFLGLIESLQVTAVLNIGCPRLHEEIRALRRRTSTPTLETFLLDIDSRFADYFPAEEFAQYNMFNHYFFHPGDKTHYSNFITKNRAQDLLVVMDPPFGGMVQILANTLRSVLRDIGTECRILWVFPYFMEKHIEREFPGFEMISYKVEYESHSKFKAAVTEVTTEVARRGSPIRIFTNMRPELIHLPQEQGYWFCEECCRYSAVETKHCFKCAVCPSKDGKTWKHCHQCGYCVKGEWKHCNRCQRCHAKGCLNTTGN